MSSSRNTNRSFAPAFGRKKKEDDYIEFQNDEGFAPAFRGSKRKDTDDGDFEGSQYSFLKERDHDHSNEWSTYDPQSKIKNYNFGQAPPERDSQRVALGPWNNWGVKTNNNGEGSSDVKNLFVGVDEIMTHDKGPRNAFEAANKSALALGSKSKTIVNIIGDQYVGEVKIKRDDRVQYLDENGNYIDGQNRGQLPKRILEEHARKVKQWKGEIAHASFVKSEWNSLTPEQQAQRKEDAAFNMQEMLKSVELVEEEEVPEEYQRETQDTSKRIELIEEELPLFVGDSDDEASSITSTTTTSTTSPLRPSKRVAFSLRKKSVPRPLNEIGRDILRVRADKVDSSYKDLTIRSRSISYDQPLTPGRQTPRGGHQKSHGSPPRGPRNQATHRRERGYHMPPPPPPSLPRSKPMSETSLFSIEKFPHILPLADIEESSSTTALDISNGDLRAKYWKTFQQTVNAPRLVIIQLHRNLTFSSEAVVSRVFGGNVQEFQFFPDTKQALVAFLYPWEAAAFFNHVASARSVDHEFRRLQLATHWHMGQESMGIFEIQENIIKHVLTEGATRVLHVKGIDKRINHDMLLSIFKDRFPNLVRLKLVVPTKMYEREDMNSNSVIMEFSSILHAIHAHEDFLTSKTLRTDYPAAVPSYLTDPCAKPLPAQPWCNCLHCRAPVAEPPTISLSADDSGTGETISMPVKTGRKVNPWNRNAAYLATHGGLDNHYDFENDAVQPEGFAREGDKHY